MALKQVSSSLNLAGLPSCHAVGANRRERLPGPLVLGVQTGPRMLNLRLLSASSLAILCLAGCGSVADSFAEDAEDGFVVDEGKVDDFLSLKAKEFIVTGTG